MFWHYFFLAVSVAANVAGGSVNNRFSKDEGITAADKYRFNIASSAAALLIAAIFAKSWSISPYTLVMGILFGILNGGSFFARTFALSEGSLALTTLIGSCGMLIPTAAGVLFWGEGIGLLQIVGIVVMIGALALVVGVKLDGKLSVKWLIYNAVQFLCVGFISILQKLQQGSDYAHESGGFLMIAFIVSALINGVMLAVECRKSEKKPPHLRKCAWGFLTGCGCGINHVFNLALAGMLPAVIFFPIANGGGILLSGLAGWLLFGEKCTGRQWLGFLLGTASILMIGLG
ncbi:MAG: hypothetical protein E7632_04085 [Ruminococcaceae bacterium]|nr:hypothetical protein [Oscillospiraceae bacterium]